MTLGAADVTRCHLHDPYWPPRWRTRSSACGGAVLDGSEADTNHNGKVDDGESGAERRRDRPRDRRLRFRPGDHAADQSGRLRQVLRAEGERQRRSRWSASRASRSRPKTCWSRSTSRARASTACRCSRSSTSRHVRRRRATGAVRRVRRRPRSPGLRTQS